VIFAELSPPYGTIVADPPWRMDQPRASKADAGKHYSLMGGDEICAMPAGELAADDAHLWLWTTNMMMHLAHHVVEAWGFRAITMVTWCKPGPGVGSYLRNNTEHCILATRGKPVTPDDKPLSTWYQWPRGAHSAKPAAFLHLIEQVSPGPYVELFSRNPHLGWDSWGYGYELAGAS
jgi:N6-adenosine-specific RNA methylase IME4